MNHTNILRDGRTKNSGKTHSPLARLLVP